MLKRLIVAAALLLAAIPSYAQITFDTPQSANGGSGGKAQGGVGMYLNAAGQAIPETNNDPCSNPSNTKASAVVNITSATTTQLVPVSGTTSIYICGGSFSIAPSATSADTATIEYGSGTNCGTGTTALTGAYGAGDLTTATGPLMVNLFSSGVVAVAPSGKALCLLSAGTAVNIQGIISYVQQ